MHDQVAAVAAVREDGRALGFAACQEEHLQRRTLDFVHPVLVPPPEVIEDGVRGCLEYPGGHVRGTQPDRRALLAGPQPALAEWRRLCEHAALNCRRERRAALRLTLRLTLRRARRAPAAGRPAVVRATGDRATEIAQPLGLGDEARQLSARQSRQVRDHRVALHPPEGAGGAARIASRGRSRPSLRASLATLARRRPNFDRLPLLRPVDALILRGAVAGAARWRAPAQQRSGNASAQQQLGQRRAR